MFLILYQNFKNTSYIFQDTTRVLKPNIHSSQLNSQVRLMQEEKTYCASEVRFTHFVIPLFLFSLFLDTSHTLAILYHSISAR